MNDAGILIPILVPLGAFAMIFGIVYLGTRQNLAMIEKGMNPKAFANRPAPFRNLKWGLLLLGAGLGLLLALLLDQYVLPRRVVEMVTENGRTHLHEQENPGIYFALIAIGGGLGLVGSYLIERKYLDKQGPEQI